MEWRGAALDRLLDETHAQLVAAVLAILHDLGWQTRVEVTFSEYGERGSIDILAWHVAARVLLVVEVKSEIAGVDPLLRPLGVKVRLAAKIAARDFGWRTSGPVCRVVVLPEESSARRAVERHAGVLDSALPARSRESGDGFVSPLVSWPASGFCHVSAKPTLREIHQPSVASAAAREALPRTGERHGMFAGSSEATDSAVDPA